MVFAFKSKFLLINYSYLALLFIVTLFFAAPSFAENSKVIYQQCSISKINGEKVGYSCETQKTQDDNDKTIIITNRYSEQKFKRLGFPVKIVQDSQFVEDNMGNPVSFSSKTESLGENTRNRRGFFFSRKKLP